MAKTIVVVNRHRVARNKRGAAAGWEGYDPAAPVPVFSVRRGRCGQSHYVEKLEFTGPGRLIYDAEHPLPCGATCWLELDPGCYIAP